MTHHPLIRVSVPTSVKPDSMCISAGLPQTGSASGWMLSQWRRLRQRSAPLSKTRTQIVVSVMLSWLAPPQGSPQEGTHANQRAHWECMGHPGSCVAARRSSGMVLPCPGWLTIHPRQSPHGVTCQCDRAAQIGNDGDRCFLHCITAATWSQACGSRAVERHALCANQL